MKKLIALVLCSMVVASLYMVSLAVVGNWYVYYGSQYDHDTIDYVSLCGADDYRATVTDRSGNTLYNTDITIGYTTRRVFGVGSHRDFNDCHNCTSAKAELVYTGGGGYTKGSITIN